MKKVLALALIALISFSAFAGGSSEATSAPAASSTTTTTTAATSTAAAPEDDYVSFVIANAAEPESLDPSQIQGVPEHRIFEALFEGLVAVDPQTADGVPGVAES